MITGPSWGTSLRAIRTPNFRQFWNAIRGFRGEF